MDYGTTAALVGRDERPQESGARAEVLRTSSRLRQFLKGILSFAFVCPWFFVSLPTLAQNPATVMLAWDPSPDPDVLGYFLYYGSASHTYTNVLDVGSVTNATVTDLAQGNTYYFVVTAYTSIHLESLPSDEVHYTVPVNTNAPSAPTISIQPTNQTVVAGGTANFQITASGSPPPSFQWFFNQAVITGATNSILSLSNVQPGQAGAYNAVVQNSAGSVTSAVASLTIVLPASISKVSLNGSTLSVSFESVAGLVHVLEYTDSLAGGSWIRILPALPGTGSILTVQDNSATAPARFYRIISY